MTSTAIPVTTVTGGMTQAPAKIAAEGKFRDLANFVPIPDIGLAPRAGTRHLGALHSDGSGATTLLHPVDLGGGDKYILALSHGSVKAFASNGDELEVWAVTRDADGNITGGSVPDFSYLDLRAPNTLSKTSGSTACDPEGFSVPGWTKAGAWGTNPVPGDGANESPLGFSSSGPGSAPDRMTTLRDNGTGGAGTLGAPFVGWNRRRLRVSVWVDTTGITNHLDRVGLGFYFFSTGSPQYVVDFDFGGDYTSPPSVIQSSSDGSVFLANVEQPNGPGTGLFRLSMLFDPDKIAGSQPPEGSTNYSAVLRINQGPGGAVVGELEAWGYLIEENPEKSSPVAGPYARPPGFLRTVQALGTSFVANPAVPTRMAATTSPTLTDVYGQGFFAGVGAGTSETVDVSDAAYVFVRQGATNTSYTVDLKVNDPSLGNVSISFTHTSTTGATADDADVIAAALAAGINAHANNTDGGAGGNEAQIVRANNVGPVIRLRAKGGGGTNVTFKKVEVNDSLGNVGLVSWHNTIDSISKLPLVCQDGTRVRLVYKSDEPLGGSPVQAILRFVAQDEGDFSSGYWAEGPNYGDRIELDASTLPHILVRRQDDDLGTVTGNDRSIYFEWGPHTWTDKAAGNSSTNPIPSFVTPPAEEDLVDRYVDAVGFFKGRLFLASSAQYVCASEVSRYGNFWRTTVQTIPDSDRIDIAISIPLATRVHDFVQAQDRLYLPSGNSILALTQGDVLSPNSVGFSVAHVGDVSRAARAIEVPGGFAFATGVGAFDQLRLAVPVADDKLRTFPLTDDIPRLIPTPIDHLAWSDQDQTLVVSSSADRTNLWCLRLVLGAQGAEQSAWYRRYTGPVATPDPIFGVAVLGGDLFLAVERASAGADDGTLWLERAPLDRDPQDNHPTGGVASLAPGWEVRLDRRLTESDLNTAPTYSGGSNETTFTLPYHKGSGTYRVVRRAFGSTYGQPLTITGGASNTIVVSGDHTATKVYLGLDLTASAVPLEPVDRNTFTGQVIGNSRLLVRSGAAHFERSAYGRVKVTDLLGTATYDEFGVAPSFPIPLITRSLEFGVMSNPDEMLVELVLDDDYPFIPTNLVGLQWIVDVVRRGAGGR